MILFKRILIKSSQMSRRALSDFNEFNKILNESKNIVAVTGAGVSAESGIPVFRGAGGLWRTYRATDLATPQAFKANPALVWEFYHYRREVAFKAQPNNAHITLAKYEEICKNDGRQFSIITQNVDGSHRRAGSQQVVELHGTLDKVICTKCKQIEVNLDSPICEALRGRGAPEDTGKYLPLIDKKDLPKCKQCNGLVRPYIVWFGENLDSNILNKARELVETCDLCLVIGTSSLIYPAAGLAAVVTDRGKPVAEFNLNEEPASDDFMFHFSGPCGTTLPKAFKIDL